MLNKSTSFTDSWDYQPQEEDLFGALNFTDEFEGLLEDHPQPLLQAFDSFQQFIYRIDSTPPAAPMIGFAADAPLPHDFPVDTPLEDNSPSAEVMETSKADPQTRGRKKEERKYKNMNELQEAVGKEIVKKWICFSKMNTNEARRKDSLKRTYFRYIKEYLTTLINFRFKEGELRHSSITLAGI